MPNVLLRIYPNGEVLYSIRISLVLSCTMDLKYYPLDSQTCFIKMVSCKWSFNLIYRLFDLYFDLLFVSFFSFRFPLPLSALLASLLRFHFRSHFWPEISRDDLVRPSEIPLIPKTNFVLSSSFHLITTFPPDHTSQPDGYTTDDLIFKWKNEEPVQMPEKLHLPRFSLQNFKTKYCNSITNTGEQKFSKELLWSTVKSIVEPTCGENVLGARLMESAWQHLQI